MKTFFSLVCMFIAAFTVTAQAQTEILATAAGSNFTPASLSAEGQKLYAERKASIENARQSLLTEMIKEILIDLESKAKSITPENLLASAIAKSSEPSAAEVQAFYNANSSEFGGRSLPEMRGDIVRYLKRDSVQKAEDNYLKTLANKYKATFANDVNAAGLKPSDALTVVSGKSISVQDFEKANKVRLNDIEVGIYEDLRSDLKAAITSVLLAEEAKARGIEVSGIYAAEVTGKLREFTEQEKSDLETALQKRLLAKYSAKILLKEPVRYAQTISADDDPSVGPSVAPVTIVMFSDFQCPACAAAHPILKSVIAEYPGKVRFVVRDYPLLSLHKNAMRAAVAANAAKAQGKYFEYAELLYANQSALDDASLKKYAAGLGLNLKRFELDLNDEKFAAEVRKDMADAAIYGVSWTPTIYVGGVKLQRGSAEHIREAIDRALGK